jgi:hypothetical protein
MFHFKKLVLVILASTSIFSQSNQSLIKTEAPNVFIDCRQCNLNHIKEHVPIVNYVLDRKDSDVHILFSTLTNGSGGTENYLFFIGQKSFNGLTDTVNFTRFQTDSEDVFRNKVVDAIKIGLVKFIAKSNVADQMIINYKKSELPAQDNEDDWNFWVFNTNFDFYFYGQESMQYYYLSSRLSANRVTESLKLNFSTSGNYSENSYKYEDDEILSISRSQYVEASIIKSIDNHWSWGAWFLLRKSIYNNIKLGVSFAPGIEYNIFPYSESNKRQWFISYQISHIINNYDAETIFLKTNENLWENNFYSFLSLIEQWGSISFGARYKSFLHDLNKYEISFQTRLSLKLVKGLSIDLSSYYSKIRNQINLIRGTASLEEVLLQRRQLETGYYFNASVGFSYRFGSIYNNIVNPRFSKY